MLPHGGDLIVDIPSLFKGDTLHKCKNSDSCFHKVTILDKTLLISMSYRTEGNVNTNHHQAIGTLSDDFAPSAFSDDGILEAFEYVNYDSKPFFMGVQWHPERLPINNPLSGKIGAYFIAKARIYKDLNELNSKTRK